MTFSLPVFVWMVLVVISIGNSIFNHGEFFESNAITKVIGTIMQIGLLIWGGFFSYLGFPQAIYIGITFVDLLIIFNNHGKMEESNFFNDLFGIFITSLLFWWGGFFG